MRGKNLIKLLKVLDLLSTPQGATRKDIAEKLEMTDRSVSRFFKSIEDMGFPLYDDKEPFSKEKRWYLEPAYVMKLPNITIPDISLSFSEIISLFMLKGEAAIFKGTEIEKQIISAFFKLLHFVPDEAKSHLENLRRISISKSVNSKCYKGKEKIIGILTESVLNQTTCKLTYHTFYTDEVKETEIGPLHFYENSGGLYLFGLDLRNNKVKSYAIERIKRIRPFETNFEYPEDFDPEKRLDSAFDMTHGEPVTVKVRFSEEVARYIRERNWAIKQTLTDNPDGSVTLAMVTSGYRDVKSWIMSFGANAELIEPEEMKQEIIAEFQKNLKNYQT